MLTREQQIEAVFDEVRKLTTVPRGLIVRQPISRIRAITHARARVAVLLVSLLHTSHVEAAEILCLRSHSSITDLSRKVTGHRHLSAEVAELSATLRSRFWPQDQDAKAKL